MVKALILDGKRTGEIYKIIKEEHNVAYATVRKDVMEIRKAHLDDIDKATELEGTAVYFARTMDLRTEAKLDRDLKLVHTLNQELARLFGVNLKIDDKNFRLTLDSAIDHMDKVIKAVFSVITESALQDRIIEAIDSIAEE